MGQASHPLWPRLGMTNTWLNTLNDSFNNKYYRHEKITLLKTIISFFLSTSNIYYKTYWWYKYTTCSKSDNINTYVHRYNRYHYNINLKTKTYRHSLTYTLQQVNKRLIKTDIYMLVYNNYWIIYWFWGQYCLNRYSAKELLARLRNVKHFKKRLKIKYFLKTATERNYKQMQLRRYYLI